MNNLICTYCNTEFLTISSLNHHQKKAKYCLIIQGKIEAKKDFRCNQCEKILSSKRNLESHTKKCKIIEEENEFKCKYCEKILSSKQNLSNHSEICELKKEKELEKIKKNLVENEKIIIEISTENKNYKEQIKKQEEQIKKQEEQIKELQQTIERMGLRAIERPTTTNTTTTTNNTLNITSSIDLNDVDKVKNIIEDKLNINYVIDGQKGIANFIKDNILTDDNGELIYVCTDPSRGVFKFKDTTGELKKDIEAKKLTTYILEGGIKKKSAVIGNEWCKDDTGEFDMKKFTILMVPQQSIMNLSQDNNILKRELAAITS